MKKAIIILIFSIILLSSISYSWFDVSYQNRYNINCDNLNNDLIFVLNGTIGTYINSNIQYIKGLCSGNETALYFNNYSNYILANETSLIYFEAEGSDGISYNPTSLYNANYLMALSLNHTGLDSTSNNKDGIIYGAINTTGKIDGALYFDGNNDYIEGSQIAIGTSDFTIEFWSRLNLSGVNNNQIIDQRKGSSPYNGFTFYFQSELSGSHGLHMQISDGTLLDNYYPLDDTEMFDDIWHYWVITVDRDSVTGIKYYKDGSLLDTDNPTARQGSLTYANNMHIGNDVFGGSFIEGKLDNVIVLNKVKTPDEINQSYQNILGTLGFGNIIDLETRNNFSIEVKNIYDNTYFTDYTINYYDLNNTYNQTLYNNDTIAYLNITLGNYYYIRIYNTSNFAYYNLNATINTNITSSYAFYAYEYNSVNISIYDESDYSLITDNITLDYTLGGSTTQIINDTGNIYLSNLTSGLYEWAYSSTNYADRYYYSTLLDGSYNEYNIYLLNSSDASLINFFLFCSGVGVANETITAYKNINGTYTAVAQRITDGTGSGSMYLNPSTTYRMIINSDYGTYTTSITPTSSQVSFYLCGGGATQPYNWTTIYDKFGYLIYPESLILNATNINFNLTATSEGGFINNFGIYYNSTKEDSLSGSPSGGIVSIDLNLTNKTGIYPITYYFNISGEDYIYNFTRNYRVASFTTAGNKSLKQLMADYDTSFPDIWKYIIVTMLALLVMVALYNYVPPIANSLIGFMVFVLYSYLGWINYIYLIPIGGLLLIYYIVERF